MARVWELDNQIVVIRPRVGNDSETQSQREQDASPLLAGVARLGLVGVPCLEFLELRQFADGRYAVVVGTA